MGKLRSNWPRVPIIALTATATPRCSDDIRSLLKLKKDTLVFTTTFNRPNIEYAVEKKASTADGAFKQLAEYIRHWEPKTSGIVYCLTRAETEQVNEFLTSENISSAFYHAGMSTSARQRVQRAWQKGKENGGVSVVCATIAMGMGIDKPDVRYIVHYSMPKSLEGYYQESGRAGRDGKRSECILFYSKKDYGRVVTLAMGGPGKRRRSRSAASKHAVDSAKLMNTFCEENSTCRRVTLLAHFGERADASVCGGKCDVCSPSSLPRPWAVPPSQQRTKRTVRKRKRLNPLDFSKGGTLLSSNPHGPLLNMWAQKASSVSSFATSETLFDQGGGVNTGGVIVLDDDSQVL